MFLIEVSTLAQQNVGISDVPITPHSSSVLEVFSTNKGLLIPRLTSAQRQAIVSPADGLIVYDTDFDCISYFSTANNAWNFLCNTGNNGDLLVLSINEPPGANCLYGGVMLQFGYDANYNSALDNSEIVPSLTKYVCNGAPGATGAQGPIGLTGPVGPQGVQGPIGLTGPAGPQGVQGPIGLTGPVGPQGTQGPAGPVGCATANYIIKSDGTTAVCTTAPIFESTTGAVAIGNTSPGARLDVYGWSTANTGIALRVNNTSAALDNTFLVIRNDGAIQIGTNPNSTLSTSNIGKSAISIGDQNVAHSNGGSEGGVNRSAIAMGYRTQVYGQSSSNVAIGNQNIVGTNSAYRTNSYAFGSLLRNTADNTMTFGFGETGGTTNNTSNTIQIFNTSNIPSIGIIAGSTNNAGFVGVGTAAPQQLLHVVKERIMVMLLLQQQLFDFKIQQQIQDAQQV